jgi:predicted chitinase
LYAAQSSQNNVVYEFNVGNEEEYHVDGWKPNATIRLDGNQWCFLKEGLTITSA